MGGTQMKLMARDGAIFVRVLSPLDDAFVTGRGRGMHGPTAPESYQDLQKAGFDRRRLDWFER